VTYVKKEAKESTKEQKGRALSHKPILNSGKAGRAIIGYVNLREYTVPAH
jgi:hypothetical protein